MNITIVQTFTDGFTTYQSGQELSVPSEVAQRWIADGTAQADTDGQQSWLSSTEVAAVRALVSDAGIGPLKITAPDGYDVGDVLTATPQPGWTVGGYQWTRDGADISGATSSTYTLTLADVQMPHLPAKVIGCEAVSPLYTYLTTLPVSATFPAGYLSLDNSALSNDGAVLSLV